jgi:hypothetical protein
VASVVVALWATSGTQRERPLLGAVSPELRVREADAAAHPGDPVALRALAQAYLDAQQPGLALAALEGAPPALHKDPRWGHLYARALLDQGRNDAALEAEASVVDACMPALDARVASAASLGAAASGPGASGCDALLLGSALRRAAILKEMVARGIEDTVAHPEASFVAYQNATREARVSVF